ncbi:MAG: carboxypeptidase regulatory-like domain-containing protein, partial [Planctomycetes bacterium]|nr:carboxypeptidase regulatory-like domain-containing protein [Planctomycetota bacterium]
MLTRVLLVPWLPLWLCGHLQAQGMTVSGKVVDHEGTAVRGATVYLWIWDEGELFTRRMETAGDGAFAFADVQPAADGYVVAVNEGHGLRGIGFEKDGATALLVRLRPMGEIAGQVEDKDGKPLEGVKVSVTRVGLEGPGKDEWLGWSPAVPLDGLWTVTDARGQFRIRSVPQGTDAPLELQHPSCARWCDPDVKGGRQDLKYTLVPAACITGRVVFEETGKAAEGIRVECLRRESPGARFDVWESASTGSDGAYVFDNLLPGDYDIRLGGWGEVAERVALPQRVEKLGEGQHRHCTDLVLTRGGLVMGKVADRETGEPIEGATVRARLLYQPVLMEQLAPRTKPDGTYRLRLPPGTWSIELDWREGYVSPWKEARERTREMHVSVGKTVKGINFTLLEDVVPWLRVIGPDGKPVAGALVNPHQYMPTDEDGVLELHHYAANEPVAFPVTFHVFTPDRSLGVVARVKVEARRREPITIQLAPRVRVTGKIVDETVRPLKDARVKVFLRAESWGRFEEDSVEDTVTGADGRFSLKVLPGFPYVLWASAPGYGWTGVPKLETSRNKDVGKLVLQKADTFIAGRVTDEQGNPAADAHLR